MNADLNDLRSFLAVAKSGGFGDAARTANVSASTRSEAVRRLETQLGVRLLHRTTRRVTPTKAEAPLIGRLAPALGKVEAALDFVNKTAGDAPVSATRLGAPAILPGF